jgi:SOS response regulatory protein OraA/RecX
VIVSAGAGAGAGPAEHIAPVTYLFGAVPREPEDRLGLDQVGLQQAGKSSMHALARRGMSSHEMRAYLLGREFDERTVNAEVERLEGAGLLDDDALAETLARTLRERKGLGRAALTSELRRRNLPGSAIEAALDDSSGENGELDRATAIALKRAPQLGGLDSATAKRRLSAFLMRRGYSGSVVSSAVARALAPAGGPVFR